MNAPNQTSYLILLYHKIRGFFVEKREAQITDKVQLQLLLKIIMCLIQNILFCTIFLCFLHFILKVPGLTSKSFTEYRK